MFRWYVRSAPSTSSVCGPSVRDGFAQPGALVVSAAGSGGSGDQRDRDEEAEGQIASAHPAGTLRGLVQLDEVAGRVGQEGLASRAHG